MRQTFSPSSLHAHLREATAPAHAELEAALALLEPPASRKHLANVLRRFHGFHRRWEPALADRLGDPGFTGPRQRLHLLADDLRRLGVTAAEVDALPVCPDAAALCGSLEGALGSLYVLEGSTLGGRVVARRLEGTEGWPIGGLRYFDPHGEHAGARWRETLARIETAGADAARVVEAAGHTFSRLRAWLAPARPAGAAA